MAASPFDTASIEVPTPVPAQAAMSAVEAAYDAPLPDSPADQLKPLRDRLAALHASDVEAKPRAAALDRIHARSMSASALLLPLLAGLALPVPRKSRQLIRNLQDLLRALADELLAALTDRQGQPSPGTVQNAEATLHKAMQALAQHLLVSNLAASPAGVGIWHQLHQAYAMACRLQIVSDTSEGAMHRLQNLYYSTVLLGCAQPASFSSHEVNFVAGYLERFAHCVDTLSAGAHDKCPADHAAFWIDSTRDAPATACSRKPAPRETPARYFSCDRLTALLKKQLAVLETGGAAKQIGLPDFAATAAGRGVLRRLITYWGNPGKRRFPRRRQHYRAALCVGLDSLWTLFQNGDHEAVETSNWMITNESPDGYAVMHVSGKPGHMTVGEVTAIRTESSDEWQICIVRWALSENHEHLELGLQILATHAVPAFLAVPPETDGSGRLSVLILPEIPALRDTEMLVVPSGALSDYRQNLVLVIEKQNLEIREMRSTHLDEQNSQIEVFSVERNPSAA